MGEEANGLSIDHQEIARRLRDAYRSGPVPPLRDGLAANDAAGAYDVQAINTRFWQEQGRRAVGHKIGLTAKSVQAQFGVDQPDFGILFEDMRVANGGALSPGRMLQGKAEGEIALVLKSDVTVADPGFADVSAAIGSVHAAIEIVDSRIADWKITLADTVADNGSSAFFVLSEQGCPWPGPDIYSCGMVMEVNGQVVSMGAGAAALGHPIHAAVWLARTLAAQGEHLRADDVILTGALGPMHPLRLGDRVDLTIGGIGKAGFVFAD